MRKYILVLDNKYRLAELITFSVVVCLLDMSLCRTPRRVKFDICDLLTPDIAISGLKHLVTKPSSMWVRFQPVAVHNNQHIVDIKQPTIRNQLINIRRHVVNRSAARSSFLFQQTRDFVKYLTLSYIPSRLEINYNNMTNLLQTYFWLTLFT